MKQTQSPLAIPETLRGTVPGRPSNLLPALLLLPPERRSDALLFGEWCRFLDDIADLPGSAPTVRKATLEAWLEALSPQGEERLPGDFLAMIRRRNLDPNLLREIVHGMLMDTDHDGKVRIRDQDELELYCRHVASAVGRVSATIFGARGETAESYADHLGIALQLTNILRDVAEDASMDRIYIPREDLERFGVMDEEILRGVDSPRMTHLLNHQAERADSWFAKAELAWSEMTPNQKRLMRPARMMSAVYRELLLAMHRDRYDVFARGYRVSGFRKLVLLLRLMTSGN
jgi:phytoene synthase